MRKSVNHLESLNNVTLANCVNKPVSADELSVGNPGSNTGGNSAEELHNVLIDTLSLTSKFEKLPSPVWCFTDEQVIDWFSDQLSKTTGLVMYGDHAGGKNGFKESRKLRYSDDRPYEQLGFIAWGGDHMRGAFQLYITGEACEYLSINNLFPVLHEFAQRMQMVIKRIDIAYDDLEGDKTVDDAVKAWSAGAFTFTRQPLLSQQGNWVKPDGKGRTVYIGSRSSGKMLRVYEKGKQLGDPESTWTRWEIELKAVDRVIPLQAMLTPHNYFKGAYPALRGFISGVVGEVIKTVSKKAKITVEKAVGHIKTQYGAYIGVLSGIYNAERLVSLLIKNDRIPNNLIFPVAGKAEHSDKDFIASDSVEFSEWGILD